MEKETPLSENSVQLESWSEAPSYCHEDIYKSYKLLITSVADDLHDEDVSKIVFVQDLPRSQSWTALHVMQCLEKRGKFSCYKIEPLEELLRDANRCDLVTKYVTEYKRLYGGVASLGNSQSGRTLTHTTSAPPNMSPRTSRKRNSLPARHGGSEARHPSTTIQVVPEEAGEQHMWSLLQTSTRSLPTPPGSTSGQWTFDDQEPSQEPPSEEIFCASAPHSMERHSEHQLTSPHQPMSQTVASYDSSYDYSDPPNASTSGSAFSMSGQSCSGLQRQSNSTELHTKPHPLGGPNTSAQNGLLKHSSSQPLVTRCCTEQLNTFSHTGQHLHGLQHPSNSHLRTSTPPPSLPSRTVAPAVQMNLSTARSDVQLHQQRLPAAGQLAAAANEHRLLTQAPNYSTNQRLSVTMPTNSTGASVHNTGVQPPPAEPSAGRRQQLPSSHERAAQRPSDTSSGASEHSYLVRRRELYTIICEHRAGQFIRQHPRLVLDARCRANPQVGLKIFPYGLDSDTGKYATLEADIYIPRKCPLLTLDTSNVKLIVRVTDDQTGENLNGGRVLMEECKLRGKSLRIPQLISHESIARSKSLVLRVQATAELKFRPDKQAENFELKGTEEGYCEITCKGESNFVNR